jgi:TonB family protein
MKKILSLVLIIISFKLSFSQNDPDTGKFFAIVEEMPQFPGGGESAFMEYLMSNIHYPHEAREKGIEGIVIVTFTVDSTGSINGSKISRNVSPDLDAEALRVISTMPVWKPGKQNGRNVSVQYNIPVTFSINDTSKNTKNFKRNKHYDEGIKFFDKEDYVKAIESFTNAIKLDKEDHSSYYYRGVCFMKSGNKNAACDDWQKARAYGDKDAANLFIRLCD